MERRPILIGAGVLVALLAAFGVYSLFRAPFEVHSARAVNQLFGQVGPGVSGSWTPTDPEAKITVVTVKVNRDPKEMRASDFALRFTAQGTERTEPSTAVCPIDDPERLDGMWMLAARGQDIVMRGGLHSDYLHLGFLVPATVQQATLLFKGESIGSVNIQH